MRHRFRGLSPAKWRTCHVTASSVIGHHRRAEPRQTSSYYREFGLTALGDGRFGTQDGGEQLRLVDSPRRRLVEVSIGADDRDDLDRITRQLEAIGIAANAKTTS